MQTVMGVFLLLMMIGLALNVFVFQTKWRTLELSFVICACSAVIAIVLKAANEGRTPEGPAVILQFLPLAGFAGLPVLAGAYFGVRLANTVKEDRTLFRILLIIVGWMFVISALAVVYTVLLLMHVPLQEKIGVPESYVYSLLILLFVPAHLVTEHYKEQGYAKEIEEMEKNS